MDHMSAMLRGVLAQKLADSFDKALPNATLRQLFAPAQVPGKATAIIGMRRAGKTTLVHQLRAAQIAAGVPLSALPYINFEDERLDGLQASDLGFLLEEYARLTPAPAEVMWCFDEIQVIPGWERFIRRMLDEGRSRVVVTGSSASLLSREIATSLRGRAWSVSLFPFSFAEALAHQGVTTPKNPARMSTEQRGRTERLFLQWLREGGFPEVQGQLQADRFTLLKDYVDVAILRDVVERHNVSNVAVLRWLVRHLLGNAAGLFSVEKFHGALKSQGFAVAKETVHQLVSHLEDSFLVRVVWRESDSERQRMANPRKAYPIDQGLIPIFDRNRNSNIGHALESAVMIELERRRYEITYVKTESGYEVDFLARGPDGEVDLIQVCADASDADTGERELRGLLDAGKRHPNARKRLLTATRDGAPREAPSDVFVQPAYEWMLGG